MVEVPDPVLRLADRGALRFARYSLPPNTLGYCGPDDAPTMFDRAVALAPSPSHDPVAAELATGGNRSDAVAGLRSLAQRFEGAWPYLELIAAANGIDDPLDDRVVRAYWLGGPLLERVGAYAAGNHVEQRFRRRSGRWWSAVAAALEPGAAPGHAFHVMVVGPWVGLLRSGRTDEPLRVMDRCRVRRGVVLELDGDRALVASDRLGLVRGTLAVTDAVTETVLLGEGGRHPCGPVAVGDTVAMHWDRVCEVLTVADAARAARAEARAMVAANRSLAVSGPVELG